MRLQSNVYVEHGPLGADSLNHASGCSVALDAGAITLGEGGLTPRNVLMPVAGTGAGAGGQSVAKGSLREAATRVQPGLPPHALPAARRQGSLPLCVGAYRRLRKEGWV